jgi:hypothetical protein
LLNVGFARPHSKPQVAGQKIFVRLYNLAHVSAETLNHATQRATVVLATAGVRAIWQQETNDAKEAHSVDLSGAHVWRTQDSALQRYLVLAVVRGVAADYLQGALGGAFPEAQTGVNAIIFYDRVECLKQSDEIDIGILLGLAMAHEIGHVLLRSAAHSQAGIMKSPWTKADIQHAAARLGEFTAFERSKLRQRARATCVGCKDRSGYGRQ